MELPGYRENIERLDKMFPNRVTITLAECAQVLGVNIKTVYELISKGRKNPIPCLLIGSRRKVIPIVGLARWMCMR